MLENKDGTYGRHILLV